MKSKDKVKTFIAKYRVILVINALLVGFTALMIWIKPIDELRKYNIYNHPGEVEELMLPVYGSIVLSQSFTPSDTADSFEISLLPMYDEYHGRFCVKLLNDAEEVIGEWEREKLDAATGWVQYRLKSSRIEAGKEYRLVISAPDTDEFGAIGISVFGNENKAPGIGELTYKGDSKDSADKTMSLGVYRHQINFFAIAAFICLWSGVNICLFMRNRGTDKLALPILITAGLIMFFILAPGSGPDDLFHYYSSVTLSNKMLLHGNVDEVENKYKSDLPIHHNTNAAFVETYEGLRYRVNGEGGYFVFEGLKDSLKWPISHFPQALGITFGRLLKLGFIRVYTLGRLFNLAAYIALAVLAVRLVPVNKELMLMMAILPMSMQQASQLSYDAPVNGLALVFTGYIIKILNENRPFDWKNTVICTVLLVAISPLKVVYVLLGLLLLLIPRERFRSFADRLVKIGVQIVCAFIFLFITKGGDVSANVVRDTSDAVKGEEIVSVSHYTIRFVFEYPIRFVRFIIANSENHFSDMIKGMLGSSLSGFSLDIPEYLVLSLALCLIICAIAEKTPVMKKRWQTAIVLFMVITGYYAILTVFSFANTIYGAPYIIGTQGRYLIPFLFPSMYCLCGRRINLRINRLVLFVPIAFIEIGYIVEVMSNIDF